MADQPITGLPTKTASGVASTDKMLGIDSAEGYQILVRDVAKYIIENCNVSTLAGAVQTPKAAIDALNNNVAKYQGTRNWLSGVDCNDFTTEGLYCLSNNLTNAPTEWFALFVYAPRNDNVVQIATRQTTGSILYPMYVRHFTTSWSQWQGLATQSQIETLNSKLPSNQNNETQMKLIALGTRDVTFSNGVCVLDLTTILNANFRSNKTLSQCMMVQALSTSSSFVVSSHKTGDWEMTIRAARLNQQDFSETIAVNIIIFVY